MGHAVPSWKIRAGGAWDGTAFVEYGNEANPRPASTPPVRQSDVVVGDLTEVFDNPVWH